METPKYCIMTPINLVDPKNLGIKARIDYRREHEFFSVGRPKWDDSKYNKAVVGDKFAFVHNKANRVEIFTITSILNARERPDYWDIEVHRRRNVIFLGNKEGEMSWSRYKRMAGYNPNGILQGTQRREWNSELDEEIKKK